MEILGEKNNYFYSLYINLVIFVFFALSLNYKSALTFSVLSLVILGFLLFLYKLFKKETIFKSNNEQLFVIIMFILPFATLINMLFHGFDAEKYRILAKLYQGIFIYLAVKNARINKNLLMLAILIGLIFSSWNSIYEVFYLNINRAHAYMNPITYGESALLFGAIGAILSIEERMNFKNVFLLFIYWLLGVFILTMSQTRGGLPFIFIFFYFLFKILKSISISKQKIIKIILILFVFTVFVIIIIGLKVGYTNRLVKPKIDKKCSSLSQHTIMWKYGVRIFKSYPMLGLGQIGVQKRIKKDVEKGILPLCILRHKHLHNDMIDFSAKQGIMGLMFYVCFICGLNFLFKKKSEKLIKLSLEKQIIFSGQLIMLAIFTFGLADCIYGSMFRISIYTFLISIFFGIKYYQCNFY